jgi:hypothetical protein
MDQEPDRTSTRRKERRLLAIAVTGAVLVGWVILFGLDGPGPNGYGPLPPAIPLDALGVGAAALIAAAWGWAIHTRIRRAAILAAMLTLAFLLPTVWAARKVVRWKAGIWLGDYLTHQGESIVPDEPVDVCFCFVDHYEPAGIWQTPESFPVTRRLIRMNRWEALYEQAIADHVDSDGRSPQHTWFFPVGHSVPEELAKLAQWPSLGWGEIEYHLHHEKDWREDQIREQIEKDLGELQSLGACTDGYAFVHGVYALAGGDPRGCSAVGELDVLQETGCYADLTFPSLNSPAQPSQVNSIFYAKTTGSPKPQDRGDPVRVGGQGDGLMLIQGPMWAGISTGVLDDANLSVDQPPSLDRIDRWLAAHVHVEGKPNWIFVVVHTHSATEYAQDMLFRGAMQELWSELERRYKRPGYRLHYVTAREAYNIVKAAEAGQDGDPDDYRDFLLAPPANRTGSPSRSPAL